MGDGDRMPKVNFASDRASKQLKQSEIDFMKVVEQRNLERALLLKKIRKNNLITAAILGTGVISIYAYSILSIKQETFLDDFKEPEKVHQ